MIRSLHSFWRDENGAALVEFAMLLPTLFLCVGLCVEGTRTYWSYQTTITGVRDATRYLSRVVDHDVCLNGGSISVWDDKLTEIVRTSQSGEGMFPRAVSISGVSASLSCQNSGFRGGITGVATVSASLQIGVPFASLFKLAGITAKSVNAQVTDSTRILGL
ncbi:pilus assembly protein [Sulfitobacter sp. PR48]|uniref:TadE/TadG family type IV pilus assembly protein n=1 Tax=Sulfitobacter sp. PR48 TaxID=3028383 RepID=UPI00237AECD3|nr:TadE family protein [Sulfitobacter sp. PR48]MDD9719726.1 pilus assembly protein [Sulfitobacter sp. PR48]